MKREKRKEKKNTSDTAVHAVGNRRMAANLFAKLKYRDKGLIGLCLVYTFFTSVYPLFGVYLPGFLIREIESGEDAFSAMEGSLITASTNALVLRFAGILLVYFVLASVFGFVQHYITNSSFARISYLRMDFLRDILHKVMTMDFRHYENASFLDRANRVNRSCQSNDSGVELVYRNIFMMPASLISVILMIAVLAGASIYLLIPPLVFFLSLLLALSKGDRFAFTLREESSLADRKLFRYNDLTQNFAYGKDVRLYALENSIFSAYRRMIDYSLDLRRRIVKRRFEWGLLPLVVQAAATLVTLSVLLSGALDGRITVASFAVYLSAYVGLSQLLDNLARTLALTVAESRYVKEAIEFIEEDLNESGGDVKLSANGPVTVEFKDVSFSYPGSDKLVLDQISFTIEAGEKLALVGINGAGKSTIVKLMCGLHHPTSGQVLINGIDTRTIDSKSLFDCFSVVFQSESALAFTVAEHVAASLREIDREKVDKVLGRMGLREKIASSEEGMDQMLQKIIDPNGLMLSGGEEQKLMLARAAYRDAPVMILDEPTSALDALAETKVYNDFSTAMEGKSALFISHRLASTSFCDRIILLSGGHIVEAGTHEELMKNQAEYYDMFVTQGKYYQEGSLIETADNGLAIEEEVSYA